MRKQEVREYITDMGLDDDEFFEWMNGQTVGLYQDKTFDYYKEDVKLWVEFKMRGKELVWD